jgi:hypothetical protein
MPLLKSLLVAALLAVPCAAQGQEAACPSPGKAMLRAEIYFGRNIGGRLAVGERTWRQFVARELTPRFPQGLTVIDGQGQWRGPAGVIVREPSKIVVLLVTDAAPEREAIAKVAAAYKQLFKQDSVAVVTRAVCVAF